MSENKRHMLVQSFDVTYYIAKQGRPYSDFPELIELEKMHGMKFLSSYGHMNAWKQFIHFKSKTIFNENVKKKLLHANFVTVLCDTNITTENCTFSGISKMLRGGAWGNDLHLHKKITYQSVFHYFEPCEMNLNLNITMSAKSWDITPTLKC